jgi:ribosomal protein S18 acetylase RimI-like enzyme
MARADYAVRRAVVADAPALAQLHVATWRETYTGLAPDEKPPEMTLERRTQAWARMLHDEAEHASSATYLVERDGKLIAFGSCGRQRDEGLVRAGFDGEITQIGVLLHEQRRGVGGLLMRTMVADLAARHFTGFSIWVPRHNLPARAFYEQLGGEAIQRENPNGHGGLKEIVFGWTKLPTFA